VKKQIPINDQPVVTHSVESGRALLIMVAGKDPLDEPGGGHSSYVRAHARATVAAGWWPQILCVGATPRRLETEFGTIRRYRTPYRPIRQLMIPGHARVLARALVEVADEVNGPVLAHGFGVWGAGAVEGVACLRAAGRTASAAISSYTAYRVEHDSLVRSAGNARWRERATYRAQALWVAAVVERWERRAYHRADRVWANYDAVRRIIAERHGDELRVDLIPYGSESGFEPLPPPMPVPDEISALDHGAAPLVVCVACHHSRKGVDVLINALARLRDDNVGFRACLVGGGPLLEAHRRCVNHLRLERQVAVSGCVPSVDPYLQAADGFVLASREEQSGALALLEAQRLGLPVVASAVDGIPEDVTDGETGLLVPPDDPVALATALATLLADPELRHRLAAAGRRRFDERFAPGRFTAGLAAAYADLGFHPPDLHPTRLPQRVGVLDGVTGIT
jgi:glycosyltransferase involved in cell wall biosynthesis